MLVCFIARDICLLTHLSHHLWVPSGVDTDKYKYPIGSGRVTFNSNRPYMKAVTAAFIEIKTSKFTKKVGWTIALA